MVKTRRQRTSTNETNITLNDDDSSSSLSEDESPKNPDKSTTRTNRANSGIQSKSKRVPSNLKKKSEFAYANDTHEDNDSDYLDDEDSVSFYDDSNVNKNDLLDSDDEDSVEVDEQEVLLSTNKKSSIDVEFQGDLESSDDDDDDDDDGGGGGGENNLDFSDENNEEEEDAFSSESEAISCCHQVCDSKYDAVTNERLNVEHICWSPHNDQGGSKQCFAIETLYRISKSMNKNHWLQPPHFRSRMDDSLLEQIRKKFGDNIANAFSLDSLNAFHRNNNNEDNNFDEALNGYMYKFLTSNDLYVCPICYTHGIHKLAKEEQELLVDSSSSSSASNNESDSESDAGTKRSQRVYRERSSSRFSWLETIDINNADPMDTLSRLSPNDGELDAAATFCFRKITEMKNHLKTTHSVDVSIIDGNDLFQRYRIRGTDGLLQHFVYKDGYRSVGVLQAYWNYGNAGVLLYLLFLVDHIESIDPEAHLFCAGIGRRTSAVIWSHVSAPYEKVQEADYDFIDERNESDISEDERVLDDEESSSSPCGSETNDPEIEFVRSLRQIRGKASDEESTSSSCESNEDSVEEEEVWKKMPQQYEESEEEQDEWLVKKRMRKRQSSLSPNCLPIDSNREVLHRNESDNLSSSNSEWESSKRSKQSSRQTFITPVRSKDNVRADDKKQLKKQSRLLTSSGKQIVSLALASSNAEESIPRSRTKRSIVLIDSDDE